ncbi:MAG TPA: DUF2244 domain-containing protein [Rhizomicrobium sp.]
MTCESAETRPILYEATLRPNPPMGAGALVCVVAAVAAIDAAFGVYFLFRGAWPVTPFMGLDVVLLIWAFHASRKAAKHRERLSLTATSLLVDRYPSRGAHGCVEFNPYWVRVELDEALCGRRRLMLASHGRTLEIGAFLSPDRKSFLVQGLRAALSTVRRDIP